MKTLKNVKTSLSLNENGDVADYKSLCRLCVNTNQKGPIYPEDMAKRVRVIAAINESPDDEIELEDADAETLKTCVAAFGFPIVNEQLVEFHTAVREMKPPTSKKRKSNTYDESGK